MTLRTNDKAPAISLLDQKGKKQSLDKYKGSWVLLYFYPKDFTSGCTKEACAFRDNWPAVKQELVVLGISADSSASHLRFKQEHELPFDLLADIDRTTIKSYGANGVVFPKRVSFLIDPKGIIKKIYRTVKPEQHATQVLHDVKKFKGETAV